MCASEEPEVRLEEGEVVGDGGMESPVLVSSVELFDGGAAMCKCGGLVPLCGHGALKGVPIIVLIFHQEKSQHSKRAAPSQL